MPDLGRPDPLDEHGAGPFQIISGTLNGDACERCGTREGERYLIRDPFRGVAAHVLHEDCAPLFYGRSDEHGAPVAGNGGTEPGLSHRRIRELADWYKDETNRRYNDGTFDTAELDAELRAILHEEVAFPEHVEIEFQRVLNCVFA